MMPEIKTHSFKTNIDLFIMHFTSIRHYKNFPDEHKDTHKAQKYEKCDAVLSEAVTLKLQFGMCHLHTRSVLSVPLDSNNQYYLRAISHNEVSIIRCHCIRIYQRIPTLHCFFVNLNVWLTSVFPVSITCVCFGLPPTIPNVYFTPKMHLFGTQRMYLGIK